MTKKVNRWLIFKVYETHLLDFLEAKISLKTLLFYNSVAFLMNLDNHLKANSILFTNVKNLPLDYLPSEEAFFDPIHYETYAQILKDKLITSLNNEVALKERLQLK